VILTASMLVSFVLFVFVQSMNELSVPTLRLVSTNYTPLLTLPEDCKHHLFVSHIWASGQDKVHKIVRSLQLYIKGVDIWLDVDALENLGDLEDSVAESAHFVLYYSKGFFNSFNCRREVVQAQEAEKPITVMFESRDVSVDRIVEMREEFRNFWPEDLSPNMYSTYIFAQDPILWISNGTQFSLESIKLVAGRLLKSIPYYQKNADLLDAGVKIDGEIKPVEISMPMNILYCSTNPEAHDVAQKLVRGCKGNISVSNMNRPGTVLREDGNHTVMLVYLNKNTFKNSGCLFTSIVRAIDINIRIVLVHENDANKGGCDFWEIIEQTPTELRKKPYNIYEKDIAVSLYSIEEYQKISIRLLLAKMGAEPIDTKGASVVIEEICEELI